MAFELPSLEQPRRPKGRKEMLRLLAQYADEVGWFRSHAETSAIDASGQPIPWYTYPAIAFLARAVRPELDVFEFGTGNSTLWWAARVRTVTSVEHNREWAAQMMRQLPTNVIYRWIRLEHDGVYCRAAQASGRTYDVIVVDGKDRENCTVKSLDSLTPRGVIVWDNANVSKYEPLFSGLGRRGFRRLPFVGHGPISARTWETSIFYRPDNCLNI